MHSGLGMHGGLGLTRTKGGGDRIHLYVDSVAGNDANPGTEALPLATWSAASALLQDGQTIGFKRGSHFYEYLNLLGFSNVRAIAYGDLSDPMPVFDCSEPADNADFTKTGGYTNIYQITWTHELPTDITKRRIRAWEEGENLKWVSSLANCDATAGTFFVDNSAISNPATIYIHPNGSTNPISDGKQYDFSMRDHAINVVSSCYGKQLHGRRNAHHDFSVRVRQGAVIEECLASDGIVHNLWAEPGANPGIARDCVAYKMSPDARSGSGTLFISYSGACDGLKVGRFIDCFAYYQGLLSSSGSNFVYEGYYAHGDGGSYSEARWNGLRSKAMGINCANVAAGQIYLDDTYQDITSDASNSTFCFPGSAVITCAVVNGMRRISAAGTVVRHLYAYQATNSSGGPNYANGMDIQYSTFACNPSVADFFRRLTDANRTNLTFKNNIVQNYAVTLDLAASEGTCDIDYNCYWSQTGGAANFVKNSTSYNTLAAWQAATPYDDNSTRGSNGDAATNPLLTDPANLDFTIDPASPANTGGRNAGARQALPYEYPDWDALVPAWEAGFLGIDGTGL